MGERDWISKYFKPLASSPGAGALRDDVAELSVAGGPVIATVDALVEEVHFLPDDPIETVARKLVRTNVSDVLAKGGRPLEALLTLGWPDSRPEEELARFAAALGEELAGWGARLVGGDTTVSPQGLFLSLTLTGQCGPDGPIRRSGAAAGDALWVTGQIGAACLGYRALREGRLDEPHIAVYREPSLAPIEITELLRACATGSMDVSDGLLGDARMLAEASGLSVRIDLDAVPFAGEVSSLEECLALASWGDDYQVLFAAPDAASHQILSYAAEKAFQATRIGQFASGSGLTVIRDDVVVNLPETLGFEHG
ncbi:thiamine-phosphate kinase [uncultured Hyphomonas sp.]|uniref:thiamine-phosphate kinase n=1 Tax=uncultured Hyphomonas sp. TaxID=225298 RepID=UPI002AAB6448|nr:thiamine-phosphate kinase [uncultured Hyphomonas sp.]